VGSGLGLSVAVDGIPDAEPELSLIDHGCDVGQGALFSRPIDAEAARAMFSAARDRGAEAARLR
jgi:EAL domain-containing protein (putative c-di-GMP-specific phosphodiesterase class I)